MAVSFVGLRLSTAALKNVHRIRSSYQASIHFWQTTICSDTRKGFSTSAVDDTTGIARFKRYNVGIIGVGRIGCMHLSNVLSHRQMNLRWVVDDSSDAHQLVKTRFYLHDTPFFPSSETARLLDDDSLDGVLVFTPTSTHATLVTQALEKGKAVFVEKPTAENVDEVQSCYELAEKVGRPLLTGFQRRFDPAMQDVYHTVVELGAVGKVHNVKTVSRDSPKPSYAFLKSVDKTGCNILTDMAVHDVDMLVWLTQALVPELIYVVTQSHDPELKESGIADSITVVLSYKQGIIATIDSCREAVYGYDIRVEVFGSEGMAAAENPREATSVVDCHLGGRVKRLFHSFPERFEKAFKLEMDHFVRCMQGTEKPILSKEEAVLTGQIIEKGLQSFREKKPIYF